VSRHLLVLNSTAVKERACRYVKAAPFGTRVEFKAQKRSLPQNDRMWAMLTDVAAQKEHNGRKYPPHIWKVLFMKALGCEVEFIPALDGATVIPLGYRSSDLSKQEMSDLIECIAAWGASNGVTFHDGQEQDASTSLSAQAQEGG